MSIKSLFIVACIVASTSLFGQPTIADIVLYAPTITETMDQEDLFTTYTSPVPYNDEAYLLTPSGNVVGTLAGSLAVVLDKLNQTGTYRIYFPLTGLRTKLIVE
jgi:hypothetical protein